jgi:hypothetical protein
VESWGQEFWTTQGEVRTSLNWFRKSRVQLNLELNLRFGSAGALDLELNFGSVRPGSGSN